jgi:putative MATE family efflux protein
MLRGGIKMQKTKKIASLTEGPIFTRLLLFVVPLVLSGVLQVMYNMADNIVVGRFSGDFDALGAVGSTASFTTLIINFMISISAGAGVVVAQFYGAKNDRDVSRTVHTSMALSVVGGIMFMIAGLLLIRPILTLMGTQDIYYDKAVLYATIICFGIPASSILNFGASILRSIGDSKSSLYILGVSGLVNVGLNLFFVIVCGMAVEGVAIATIISQYISAIAIVSVLVRRKNESYALSFKKLKIEMSLVSRIMRIGLPIAFQSSLFSISNIIITSSVNTFPPSVVSAKTIAFNIEGITYTVMHAFSNATMTFIGQNYGARKHRRINRIFLWSVLQVAAAGILVAQAEILFARQLASMYIDSNDPSREAIIQAVIDIFNIMLATYFLCGIMEVISGILKGLGFSISSMVASLIGLVIRVGWILFVTPTEKFHTIFGLFFSYTLSWLVTIVLLLVCCAYAWKKLNIWKLARDEKAQLENSELNAI